MGCGKHIKRRHDDHEHTYNSLGPVKVSARNSSNPADISQKAASAGPDSTAAPASRLLITSIQLTATPI
jgi:hypothetical protein